MRARGFTLVEVMVALAVVAIALPALLFSLYQQADDTAYLRDKALAQMVAANQLAEMRLAVAATRALKPGKSSGQAMMAERDWFWWVEIKTTEVEQFYRMEIAVAQNEEYRDSPLYTLIAFMSGDLEMDLEGLPGDDGDSGDSGDSGDPLGGDTGLKEASKMLGIPNDP